MMDRLYGAYVEVVKGWGDLKCESVVVCVAVVGLEALEAGTVEEWTECCADQG